MNTYVEPPAHPISEEAKKFLASLPEKERILHEEAAKMLGSSYFVEKTHGFRKWKASQPPPPVEMVVPPSNEIFGKWKGLPRSEKALPLDGRRVEGLR
jgi:hypothetical protein